MENYINNTVRNNSIIKLCVLLGELCISCGLFYIFYLGAIYQGKYTELTATLPQVLIIIFLCYLVCCLQGGIVLHLRKIYPYQIIMRVFRNVFYFSILSGTFIKCWKVYEYILFVLSNIHFNLIHSIKYFPVSI